MDCLNNIIGLSQTECLCLTSQLPTGSDEISDYNVSASGVFLDQLPGFNMNISSGADDCASGGIWERMNLARTNAIQDYKTNLLACLGMKYKPRINNFSGQLGQASFTGNLNLTSAYAGQKITPRQIKGGFITLKRIGILINQNANVTVHVYSNENTSTLIYSSTPIASAQNTLTWAALSTPLELPMWNDNQTIEYYVIMELNGTFQPKSNKQNCGCGGQKIPYAEWLVTTGANGNDIANPTSFRLTTELNGIVLDISATCKVSELICSSQYPLDFENDVNALSIAYAIRFRAAAILYENILGSDNINRFTMMNRDEMARNIVEWNNKYTEWINYACENSNNLNENDCLICKEGKNDIIKRANIVTGVNRHGHQY
jgi:hypothetical protein